MSTATIRALLDRLDDVFPASWAEPWDRVGLLVGDPGALLHRVFVSLDPTPAALAAAIDAGAQVLLTHHPVFLETPAHLAPGQGVAGVPFAAASAGIALVACHTNLDRAPAGADALPQALGLRMVGPLESSSMRVATLVTYLPRGAVAGALAALHGAGAGRIGHYAQCSFVGSGTGSYLPLEDASPAAGEPGSVHEEPEERIEVVCEPGMLTAAIEALRRVHPYEEPVVLTGDAMMSRGAARMGRVCETPAGSTVASLAAHVGGALGVRVRVWGDGRAPVALAGVAPGSGRSLVRDAREAGCGVLITGELRYHEALDAVDHGLAIIEAGHDATEWPLVPVLAAAAARTAGLSAAATIQAGPSIRWWTTEGE
ncbi:MAG: Nif3-like dinuclear metal center hexameric protein [Coriobacteriia bacterium]|nr:Nif3-like dinuclear metal center hexameric protein [Coriobacteriia bacterium]